jgi:hypothetical protein
MQAPRFIQQTEVMLSQASQLPPLIFVVADYFFFFGICTSWVSE